MQEQPHIGERLNPHDRLKHAIELAAHLLPAQGPISVFIHHNTLHAFENLPFERAVRDGGRIFGCEPFLSEARYHKALDRGRIRFSDLECVLKEDLGSRGNQIVAGIVELVDLQLAMLQYQSPSGTAEELQWFVVETDALRRIRPEASAANRQKLISETRRWVLRDLRVSKRVTNSLSMWLNDITEKIGGEGIESWEDETWERVALEALWQVCCDGRSKVPGRPSTARAPLRHRDLILQVSHIDIDLSVHEVLTGFCAAFLDQGVSHWALPDRDQGFFSSFCSLYRRSFGPPHRWRAGLARELARLQDSAIEPLQSIHESLSLLGVPETEWDAFLSEELLSLRGWAGMVKEVEIRSDRVAIPIPAGSLVGFVAVRLVLVRIILANAARESIGFNGSLSGLREELRARIPSAPAPGVASLAFPIFQIAQVLGWTPHRLAQLTQEQWENLIHEFEAFDELERRRILHLAFERHFRGQVLDALSLHSRERPFSATETPRFQMITCLDEREESFRRTEEISSDCETYGVAGFFAVPMYYKGLADAHFIPLSPIVVSPSHWVEERAVESLGEDRNRLRRSQKRFGTIARAAHIATKTFAMGAVFTITLGVLASIPLVARILFPRMTAKARRRVGRMVQRKPSTHLCLERLGECEPGQEASGIGFILDEMGAMTERLLRDIGLTKNFSKLIFTIGHGSSSVNNPHRSAYDCGACGGSSGSPNARAAAQLLNDPRVRSWLSATGIAIPESTWFVGGVHNTCDDSMTYHDADRIPRSHLGEFARAKGEIDRACARNAHERCRRFMSAPLSLSFDEAKQHVEARSEDLAQTRPELGHATNAICHVGRRERTRGLYFDRRAFLAAYDPTQDNATGDILARTMSAVFPVCGGINLEYFFSHVDSHGYGCGTKLPHNITSLLGVIDGASSDLRTGLPWQMTELHEPVRLTIVCETTPEIMKHILGNNPLGRTLTENGWIQLAVQSPTSNEIMLYEKGDFDCTSRRRVNCRALSLPPTGIAAGAITWSSPRFERVAFSNRAQLPRHTKSRNRSETPCPPYRNS